MPIVELSMVVGAIVEVVVDAGLEQAEKSATIARVLKRLNYDPEAKPTDFDTAYVFALAEYGITRPKEVVQLFSHDFVRREFRRAFETGRSELAFMAVENLLSWSELNQHFRELDISAEPQLREFTQVFQQVVDRTRTVTETRVENKIDQLATSNTQLLAGQQALSLDLQNVVVSIERLPAALVDAQVVQDSVLQADLDRAAKLIDDGKFRTAITLLEVLFDATKDRALPARTRASLLTNLGAAYYYNLEEAKAAAQFEAAFAFDPGNPVVHAQAAFAALLRGEYKDAERKARQVLSTHPEQSMALTVLLQSSARQGKFGDVDEATLEAARHHQDSRRALALILAEQGRCEEAEKLYRQNLESPQTQPQDMLLLTQLIIVMTQRRSLHDFHLPWRLPTDVRRRLEEAEQLATQAIELFAEAENPARYFESRVVRAAVRGIVGRDADAIADCRSVLVREPEHLGALINGGLSALRLREYPEATRLLELARTRDSHESVIVPLAVGYLHAQRFDDVIALIEPLIRPQDYTEQSDGRLQLLAEALMAKGFSERVETLAASVNDSDGDSVRKLEVLASIRLIQKREGDALTLLEDAYQGAGEDIKDRIGIELADLLYQTHQWCRSVALYETLVDPEADTEPTRRFLIALFNCGELGPAYALARSLRRGGQALRVVSEIEALVAENIGELNVARELYEQLAHLEPQNAQHILRAAMIDVRTGHIANAADTAMRASARFSEDGEALIGMAQILATAHRPAADVLELAYRARRAARGEAAVHLAYVGLFLRLENARDVLESSQIGVGTAVRLDREGEQRWVLIIDDEWVDKGRGEVRPDDSLAIRLMGRGQGDVIELPQGPFESLNYRIAEVQTKFVRAFQETLADFGLLFPSETGLYRMHVDPGDPTKLFRMAEQQIQTQRLVLDWYVQNRLPIGALAKLVGRNLVEAWGGLIGGDHQLIASLNTEAERAEHARLLSAAESVTVDLVALLTLGFVDQLGLLRKRFTRVFVAQTVLDELASDIYQKEQFQKGHSVIGREGERYVMAEIPPEAIEQEITFLRSVAESARANCTVLAVSSALSYTRDEYEQLAQLIGSASRDSILVAAQTSTLLYSDDLALRALARNDRDVGGVWTYAVLRDSFERRLLEPPDFHDAMLRLLVANYRNVPLDSETLLYLLEKQLWHVTPLVAQVFGGLAGPATTQDSAVGVVAECLRSVWLGHILIEQRNAITNLCLQVLTTNRVATIVLGELVAALQRQLRLAPLQLAQVETYMRDWMTVRRVMGTGRVQG